MPIPFRNSVTNFMTAGAIFCTCIFLLASCSHAEDEKDGHIAPSEINAGDHGSTKAATGEALKPKNLKGDIKPIKTTGLSDRYLFATSQQAIDILISEDDYTAQLQPIEIGIKNRNSENLTFRSLQENYSGGVLPWSDNEKTALVHAINSIQTNLTPYERHLPQTILMAKTSQAIEGGLPHTRANLILFSQDAIDQYFLTALEDKKKALDGLANLFLHELHHILSRHNDKQQDAYFSLIGFKPCNFIEPETLRAQRLTNPDAPVYKHFVPIRPIKNTNANGVIPFLRVTGPYDNLEKGSLGDYFDFSLLAIEESEGTCRLAKNENKPDGQPVFLSGGAVPDFFKAIGSNTQYIIHPEEILAENFIFAVRGRKDLPNPDIPEKISTFWNSLD